MSPQCTHSTPQPTLVLPLPAPPTLVRCLASAGPPQLPAVHSTAQAVEWTVLSSAPEGLQGHARSAAPAVQ